MPNSDTLAVEVAEFILASIDEKTGSIEAMKNQKGLLEGFKSSRVDAWVDAMVAAAATSPGAIRVVSPQKTDGRSQRAPRPMTISYDELHHAKTMPVVVDSVELAQAISGGSTVVVGFLQYFDQTIRDICWKVATHLNHPVGASLFISPPNAQGFIPHFDAADNIVVQLRGSKVWSFFKEQAPRTSAATPWRVAQRHIDPQLTAAPTIASQQILRPGDALSFPSGTLHDVKGNEHASVHITFELLPITAHDVEQANNEALAHSAPRASRVDVDLTDGTVKKFQTRVPNLPELPEASEASANLALRRLVRSAYKVMPDAPIRMTSVLNTIEEAPSAKAFIVRRNSFLKTRPNDDGTTHLITRTTVIGVPTAIANLIVSGEQFAGEDLCSGGALTQSQCQMLLQKLTVLGIVDEVADEVDA